MIGETISHYRVIQKLGGGGMGVVYEAEDLRLHRRVALKFLPEDAPSDASLQRFRREAEAASALNHPHICTIYDIGEHDGRPFIVMEKLDGETLGAIIAGHPLPVDRLLSIGSDVAGALAAAHAAGIIHRDVKPANIIVTSRGDAKLLDFGLAQLQTNAPSVDSVHATAARLTTAGTTIGTLAYMSPEQLRGESLDARTDIFSLGGVLYEMATGVLPFRGATTPIVSDAILHQPVAPIPDVPAELDRVIRTALEKDRELRIQSAEQLRAELRRLQRDSSPAPIATPRPKRSWLPIAIGAAVVVALAGIILWMRRPTPPAAATEKRLAVLPFENLGAAQDNYFADGMTDEVRSKLAALRYVEVIARASSDQYKNTHKPLPQIASELGVPYILTGRIRWQKSGATNRIRLSPELVEVSSKSAPVTRWQDEFDADLTDIFAVQARIADEVAEALKVKLVAGEEKQIEQRPTSNLAAYDAYLKGLDADAIGTDASLAAAAANFQRAVALDPKFALAWAHLSTVQSERYNGQPSRELAEAARIASQKAVQLSPDLPKASWARGVYQRVVERDTARALETLERGLRIAPDDVDLLRNVGLAEEELGNPKGAIEPVRRATTLDPRSFSNQLALAQLYLFLHRPRDARAAADRGLALASNELFSEDKAWAYLQEGDLANLRATIDNPPKGLDRHDLIVALTSNLLSWALSDAQRRLLLDRLTDRSSLGAWRSVVIADAYWTEGNADEAKRLARDAVAELTAAIARNPDIDVLHGGRAYALALVGRKNDAAAEATKALSLVKDANSRGSVLWWQSHTFALIGDQAKAISLLKQAIDGVSYVTPALVRIDPHFASLRGNPEFQKLVAGTVEH